jgi:SAM-dependent methyltransferase
MSFSADWLALREPYDQRARNREVLDALKTAFAKSPAIAVVDLACGTGSTLRAVSPYLPERQSWRLVDNDLSLLARAAPAQAAPNTTVATTPIDIARDLEAALDGHLDLVTTSALLDLVSEEWLERFVVETAARKLPVYAALSYDGRITFDPIDPSDAPLVAAVNKHQRTNKGFGPALGPHAAAAAIAAFEGVGYAVVQGQSDWEFGARDGEIQMEVIAGWASAAREIGDPPLNDLLAWLTRRRDLIASGRSRIHVGHLDFFAGPTGTR